MKPAIALFKNFAEELQVLKQYTAAAREEIMAGKDDQSVVRKICLKRGLGPAPEDPVCDSGIFCYGKRFILELDSN